MVVFLTVRESWSTCDAYRQPLVTCWSVVQYCFLFSFCFYNRLFHSFDLKTESTRKLNNFDFQWTKTLYQKYNLKHIAFFFTFSKGWKCNQSSVIIPKKISYWSPRKWNAKFHKIPSFTWNFQNWIKITQFPGGFRRKTWASLWVSPVLNGHKSIPQGCPSNIIKPRFMEPRLLRTPHYYGQFALSLG